MTSLHAEITRTYAVDCAFALRSGRHTKDAAAIYPALRRVRFDQLFDTNAGAVAEEEFRQWHHVAVEQLMQELTLPAGWSAKLVNVYLKTRAYVPLTGRPELMERLHPPLDGGLWRGLAVHLDRDSAVCRLTHSQTRIKNIVSYADYEIIIEGCRIAAYELGCRLIEVDQLWRGTLTGPAPLTVLPGVESVGREVVLWDAERSAAVIGTIVEYAAPDKWVVRLADPSCTEVHLGAGGQSRLGRWHIMRAVDSSFVLPEIYRRSHPHQEDASFANWLVRTAEELPDRSAI
jgi:hypothetical protein